jgi:uncharacterized protein YoxC
MSGLAKKILSAFVEVTPPDNATASRTSDTQSATQVSPPGVRPPGLDSQQGSGRRSEQDGQRGDGQDSARTGGRSSDRFSAYFDKLFSDANMPGPDYYEFSKMIAAMEAISDEQSRFYAAYAGLQAQGLGKAKLLSTAAEYLQILESDATHFQSTAATTLEEKVTRKKAEAEEKSQRIQSLSREIADLQQQIIDLQTGIKENEEKIAESTNGYAAESEGRKARIQGDIEKINRYIH